MKKKIVSLCLVVCLLAVAIVGGTMAYFTDTSKQTNTVTFGTVSIEQLEQQRGENGELVSFDQNQTIAPSAIQGREYGDTITFNGHEFGMVVDEMNPVDKIVRVRNTGSNPAYVRTIIAIEDGPACILNENTSVGLTVGNILEVTIDGTSYTVLTYTYNDALEAGETSMPSLLQAYLPYFVTEEDCKDLGGTWDIIALSQAVQTDGFQDAASALNAAFGEFNAANVQKWFTEE